MKKSLLFMFLSLILALTLIPPFHKTITLGNDVNIERIPSSKTAFSDFSLIGYYTNSSSPFANAAYYLIKHGNVGNPLVPFTDLSDLSAFSMVIIPFKENWLPIEIDSLSNFLNSGGIAFLTVNCPTVLLSVTTTTRNGILIAPTEAIAQTTADRKVMHLDANYSRGFQDLNGKYYPFDTFRETKYILTLDEPDIDVLFTAQKEGAGYTVADPADDIGFAIVTKKIGTGRIVYSAVSLLDLWGMRALGGSTMPNPPDQDYVRGGGRSGAHVSTTMNRLLTQIFLMEGRSVPTRWHTPYSKRAVVISRDDVDSYYVDAVRDRAIVDRAHEIPTIFYELSDDIPQDKWLTPDVLQNDSDYPLGFHIPGYHRNSPYEYTNESYLGRIQDIEAETGRPCYFECHHGGGSSGYYGQNYVRTAVEATQDLDHFVVYTSAAGANGGNLYVEPHLYILDNGTVIRAKNYYSLMKWSTIDSWGTSTFQDWVSNTILPYERPLHWLLHSQNVRGRLLTNYNDLLSNVIDPLLSELFTDPIEYMKLSLDYVENVTTSFRSTNETLEVSIDYRKGIDGFTFAIPLNMENSIENIYLDSSPIDPSSCRIVNRGHYFLNLLHFNLSAGSHNLVINFKEDISVPTFPSIPIPEFSHYQGVVLMFTIIGLEIVILFSIRRNRTSRKRANHYSKTHQKLE